MADYYIDHDVPLRMAWHLRTAGHGAVTVRDRGLEGADDDEHVLGATARGAILITHNSKDFTLLHRAWHRWATAWSVDARHGGILLLPQPTAAERDRGAMDAAALAALVLQLAAAGHPQPGELWQWQRGLGWVRQRP
jgi:hypothetical protein